jgi:hypothetical protein
VTKIFGAGIVVTRPLDVPARLNEFESDLIHNVRSYTVLNPRVPNGLTLDVIRLSPETAAATILAHIQSVL